MLNRRVAALLLLLLPLHWTSCAVYDVEAHPLPAAGLRDSAAVRQLVQSSPTVRLRLRSGRSLELSRARLERDTVFGGSFDGREMVMRHAPLDSIVELSIPRFHTGRTLIRTALVLGALAAAVSLTLYIGLSGEWESPAAGH
jgi:hypothetical protein